MIIISYNFKPGSSIALLDWFHWIYILIYLEFEQLFSFFLSSSSAPNNQTWNFSFRSVQITFYLGTKNLKNKFFIPE